MKRSSSQIPLIALYLLNTTSYLAEISITIGNVLFNLHPSKAIGYNGIGPRILRTCADCLPKPLFHLFIKSLQHCIIPADWLTHYIVPIYILVTNYRPISLLSNISKILERIVYDKIISHVSNYISPLQFGTLKDRSSLQQLLILLNHIINSNTQIDVIYLDIRKAFDSIPHRELLVKLRLIYQRKLVKMVSELPFSQSTKSQNQ